MRRVIFIVCPNIYYKNKNKIKNVREKEICGIDLTSYIIKF